MDKQKTKTVALLLALFLGGFGIHHFYLGRNTAGVLSVLFFWTFIPALVAVVNVVQILVMSDRDFDAKYNK